MNRRNLVVFIARRLVAAAVLLVIMSGAVFGLLYATPGSTEQVLLGTRIANEETRENIRERYNLDEPLATQYWLWAKDAVRLDFGESIAPGSRCSAR